MQAHEKIEQVEVAIREEVPVTAPRPTGERGITAGYPGQDPLPVYAATGPDGSEVLGLWSGGGLEVPAVGAAVQVRCNGLGAGVVVGHFVVHGYLGVLVRFAAPPDWYVMQAGRDHAGHLFGAELRV